MASLFGHIMASTALGYVAFPKQVRPLTLIAAGACAFAPDLDVLAFRWGIPYQSDWGHRGWTHSLVFASVLGSLVALLFYWWEEQRNRGLWLWLVLSTASHPLLDMLTNGGRGVALWWPFSSARLFFPFRPVQVSPLSVSDFMGAWGLEVLYSEVVWIGFPALLLIVMKRIAQRA